MSADPYMIRLVSDFRAALYALESHKGNVFQHRRLVRVNCARYSGLGTVAIDETCPADQVPVLLGNGNVWWYPIESVVLAEGPMPRELRHAVLTRAGIAHL